MTHTTNILAATAPIPLAEADEWIADPVGELVSQLLPDAGGPPLRNYRIRGIDRMAGRPSEFICQAADGFAALAFCLKHRFRVWQIELAA